MHRAQMFQDGFKAYGFNFTDKEEDPLPHDAFEVVKIGQNMRGLIADLNIYSYYFDENSMVEWTTSCEHPDGDIFAWDTNRLNLTQEEGSLINATVVIMDKQAVCPDPRKQISKSKPAQSGGSQNERKRFKPKATKESFIGSVLELIPGGNYAKTASIALDSCFRLNGELMTIPQTEEEEKLMDKTLWDYLMKKAANNLTQLAETYTVAEVVVAGRTDPALIQHGVPAAGEARELYYPEGGMVDLIHPVSNMPLHPYGTGEHYKPVGTSYWETNWEQCVICWNSLRKRNVKNWWQNRLKSMCLPSFCSQLRKNHFICIFDEEPTFTLRGLCKEAVMDTHSLR